GKTNSALVFRDTKFGSTHHSPTSVAFDRTIRHSVVVIRKAPIHKSIIVRNDRSPLPYRYILGILKTEATRISKSPGFFPIILSQPGLTGILHDHQIVSTGNIHNGVHIAG